jgi:S1-C subfamily serine protease
VGRVAGGAGGFAAGDTITSFAGIVAPPLEAVRVRWDRLPAGDTVTIGVTRDGTRRSLAVVKPTAAQLAAAGVMVVPPGAPAAAVGGTWRTAPAPGSAGEGGPVLEIVGNEIRSDDDGTLKVMMKRRDPRGAAVALHPLDQILGLHGVAPRDLADLIARYDAIAVGDRVSLRVRRRDGREEDIAFAKPAP